MKMFTRRFYHLVNAFWIIQYLNLCESRDEGKGILVEEASKLLTKLELATSDLNARDLLEIYRQLDTTYSASSSS